ncbi:MAG: hypothetical protein MJ240_14485 [Kiritimatiellae bacterium]|nr:hypothetical protein [Kiritimatiellia bacterium]
MLRARGAPARAAHVRTRVRTRTYACASNDGSGVVERDERMVWQGGECGVGVPELIGERLAEPAHRALVPA